MDFPRITQKDKIIIKKFMKQHQDIIEDIYIVGGSLLRKNSPNIDILIHTNLNELEIINNIKCNYDLLSKIDYSAINNDKIAVIEIENNIQILFVNKSFKKSGNIINYMNEYFPLSIQRIAFCLRTFNLFCYSELNNKYILVEDFCHKKHIEKYKKYYPDKIFVSLD